MDNFEFHFSGESMPLSRVSRGPKTTALNAALNPRGPREIREAIKHDLALKAGKCAWNAWHYLTTGESLAPSWYGGDWDRTYNPNPYPTARPKDIDMYEGTGVGLLYRIQGGDHMAWSLAGWSLNRLAPNLAGEMKVRSLPSEQRARRR